MKREMKAKVLYGTLDDDFNSINEQLRRFVACLNDDPLAEDVAISAPSLALRAERTLIAAVTVTWVIKPKQASGH